MRLGRLTDWLDADPETRKIGVRRCLERIAAIDGDLQAWVQVLPQEPAGSGPLSGIPFGAKDIIETAGLATEYGSAIYRGRLGSHDAAIINELRGRGAVLLGKTHTTAFAWVTPAPTRNPRNPEHTPGGSSSGSAAAVAAGMVPFAIGTQTRGSVLRPASYCGITGFKPSYGSFSMDGVLAFARSLDTLGFFTQTPKDMLRLWEALGRSCGDDKAEFAFGVPDPMPDVEPEMNAALQAAFVRLRAAGLRLQPVDLAPMLARLSEASYTVMFYEAAALYRERYAEYGDRLEDVAEAVRTGNRICREEYEEALTAIGEGRQRVVAICDSTPVLLVPAATGPAPRGLAFTGDSRMNAPWTAIGTPAISIPMPVKGLPLGLQLTSAPGSEARLLRAAERISRILDSDER